MRLVVVVVPAAVPRAAPPRNATPFHVLASALGGQNSRRYSGCFSRHRRRTLTSALKRVLCRAISCLGLLLLLLLLSLLQGASRHVKVSARGGEGALQALREGGSKRFCFSNTPLTFEKKATTFFFLLKSRPPLKKKKTSSCRRACGQHFHPAPLTRRPRDKTACGSISVVTHLTVRSAPSLSRRTTNCRRNNTYNERALELGLPLALQQEMLCGLHSLLVVLCALSGKTDAKRTSDKHTLDVV